MIVSADGIVLGRGFTQQAGGPHAEIMALRDARAQGRDVRGATVYVTLEPCSHHGRTGPCCEALAAAGVSRVVASLEDPNPQVAGKGFARLRAAGIDVEVGPAAAESRELNLGFFSRMVRRRPWVRLKVAMSLDGFTALPDGRSQWITSEESRADTQRWRARSSAILTGVGTVLADDPRLDVRLDDAPRQPHLVIADGRLETPDDARLFKTPRQVWIYASDSDPQRRRQLEARGASIQFRPGRGSRIDLRSMMSDLAAREVNELHVEAGARLNGALLEDDLVDELLVYVAPKLLGGGLGMAHSPAAATLEKLEALDWLEHGRCGRDLRLRLRFPGHAQF